MGNIFSIQLPSDAVFSRCWDCAAGQAIYTCQLEENLADLKTILDELKERRNDVMRRVNIAEQGNMKRLDQVQGWLSRTQTMIDEVDQLIIDGPEETNKLYLGGCCSKNCVSSHKFSKRVAKRLHAVRDLIVNGAFEEVTMAIPAAPVVERPSESAVGLESVFNKVWSNFEEKHVGIIGLYGIGGVGKTRLMAEINNKIGVSSGGFDVVIWVVVSKGFYIGKIQDDIAQKIGVFDGTWNDKTSEEKATKIFEFLNRKKFILLLDDIWERVDLSEVGIPIPTQNNGCKLIFTTRSLEVCGQMEARKKIEVKCLSEKEAWALFQEKVGEETLDSHPRIRELAQEVVKECEGLPLALITIGRAMACKNTPKEWEYAVGVLRRSSAASIFPDMGKKVYPLLRFSYDSLPNDMIRSCVLYCSLFSEDYVIYKERLIDCWIGEGFLDEHDSISQARNHGHHIIGCLLNACLLEKVNDRQIKMHDVIRDMTLWITSVCEEEKWKYFVQAGYHLSKVPDLRKWRGIRRMSLMKNKIENLTEAPDCPDLQTLFLNGNQLKVIDSNFFQFMLGLKVLDLSENKDITELPLGISKLVALEYVDLSCTGIRRLPIELKALKKLKCLNLDGIWPRITIPSGLISAFSKLQVLRMTGSYTWEHNERLVEELQCLNHLNVLTMTIRCGFALDGLLNAERLHSCIEEIHLRELVDTEQFNILSLANLKSLNGLIFENCRRLKELKIEWAGEGRMIRASTHVQTSVVESKPFFQNLCSVSLISCLELRDLTWLILAPNLTHFNVNCCLKMEEIINERKVSQVAELVGTLSPFARLKSIMLEYLPELKSIYDGALPFPCMESISVHYCPKLRKLPFNSNGAKGNKISIRGNEKWWEELQWEDESTPNAFIPHFVVD